MLVHRCIGLSFGAADRYISIALAAFSGPMLAGPRFGRSASVMVCQVGSVRKMLVASSLVDPTMMGTWADSGEATGSNGLVGRIFPSTAGPNASSPAFAPAVFNSAVDSLRNLSISTDLRLRSASNLSRLAVASAMVPSRTAAPLSIIPLWNNPLADGMADKALTFAPPPDCPKMVTLLGSPPNWAMLSFTQCSAWTMSSMPARLELEYSGPAS